MDKKNIDEKKKIKKKMLFLLLGIVLFFALGSTVAYFVWSSTAENKDASLTVTSVDRTNSICQKISDNNPKLIPVSSRERGRVVKLNVKQTLSEYASIMWDLTINSINTPETETTGLKHQSFKYEMVNETTGVSYGSGNFEGVEEGDTRQLYNFSENLAYNKNYTFVLYLWIDGTLGRNPLDMTDQTYSFDLSCLITGEAANELQPRVSSAADYITNLYTSAAKSTVVNNEITYNTAPSVGLMNDRKGGTTKDLDSGDIRYYGANPYNYVWLGDTYQSDYTYTSNGQSLTRMAGSKKLWRIIGIFDGRLKLIQNDPIYPSGLSWDTSNNSINDGWGINQWGSSGSYEGSDLMRLLNPGYTGVNGSLYWNKNTGTVYTGRSEATTSNVSFANTGLSASEKSLVDTAIWYLGAQDAILDRIYEYSDDFYVAERQSNTLGKMCTSPGTNNACTDEVTRTSSWIGKVGLIYPSDYGYAVDFNLCTNGLYGYNVYPGDGTAYDNTNCKTNNWLYDSSLNQWTVSPRAASGYSYSMFYVHRNGQLHYSDSNDGYSSGNYFVRPAIYIKANANISGGTGTEADPYVLTLNS